MMIFTRLHVLHLSRVSASKFHTIFQDYEEANTGSKGIFRFKGVLMLLLSVEFLPCVEASTKIKSHQKKSRQQNPPMTNLLLVLFNITVY